MPSHRNLAVWTAACWAGLGLLLAILSSCQSAGLRPAATPPPLWAAVDTPAPTAAPTATANLILTAISTPAPTEAPPQAVLLSPMSHAYQDWNNCGAVSVAMVLSYYGIERGQYEVAAVLRPHSEDKHTGNDELLAYLQTEGLEGKLCVNGDAERLRELLAASVPVIIQTWLQVGKDTGHYRVVRGYDRTTGEWILNDSYYGPEVRLSEADLKGLWAPFNYRYIPVYRPEQAEAVCRILGEDCQPEAMYRRAAGAAREWAGQAPGDLYAWFSLGDDLLALGDAAGALEAYARAMEIGLPPKMLWYRFGPFEALLAAGRYEELLAQSEPILARLAAIEELHMLRGRAFEGLGQAGRAIEEYRLAFEYHTNYVPAVAALQRLAAPLPPIPTVTPAKAG